jgi:hypothetical protein
MDPRHFRYSEDSGVAVIRLDRPERLNALTFDSYAELRDAFRLLRTRDSVRAVRAHGDRPRLLLGRRRASDIIGKLFGVSDAELLFVHAHDLRPDREHAPPARSRSSARSTAPFAGPAR